MHRRLLSLFFLLLSSGTSTAILWACSSNDVAPPPDPDAGNPVRGPFDSGNTVDAAKDAPSDAAGAQAKARASLTPTSLVDAGAATGTVDLVETAGNVHVTVTINGATAGTHGVHIHEGTSCADTSVDGSVTPAGAAGQPWNPADAGIVDFGNVTIATDGTGTLTVDLGTFNVRPDGGGTSAIGHAVVFRQGASNSGSAAACGLVQPQ